MAEDRVSRRYASALFEAAKSSNEIDAVEADLHVIEAASNGNDDFRVFLLSPNRSREEKLELFNKVFGDKITSLTSRLVKLMFDKRRESELLGVGTEFSLLRRQNEGTIHAIVTSAVEISTPEQKQIIEKLASKLGKKVESEFRVDANLIGGITVAYDEFVIDGSVRGSFSRLRESLRHDALKQA